MKVVFFKHIHFVGDLLDPNGLPSHVVQHGFRVRRGGTVVLNLIHGVVENLLCCIGAHVEWVAHVLEERRRIVENFLAVAVVELGLPRRHFEVPELLRHIEAVREVLCEFVSLESIVKGFKLQTSQLHRRVVCCVLDHILRCGEPAHQSEKTTD